MLPWHCLPNYQTQEGHLDEVLKISQPHFPLYTVSQVTHIAGNVTAIDIISSLLVKSTAVSLRHCGPRRYSDLGGLRG